ncbi:nucleotide-binding protein [Rhizobium sp. CRIBSB]|nr:nucleotide-binding protein [Rhizobium sp. CRIBSB]
MSDSAPRRSLREGLLWGDLGHLDSATLCGTLCRSCGETTLGDNSICPACGVEDVERKPLSRSGILWTYTMVRHRPPGNYQMPEPFRPFAMGLVDLPDGLKVLTRIDVEQDEIRIGMPLKFRPFVLRRDEAGAEVIAFDFQAA